MENSLYAKNVYHISYSLCSLTTTVFVVEDKPKLFLPDMLSEVFLPDMLST
jgi:hypothetical protein